jgi:release factor glutamine methyltransferase
MTYKQLLDEAIKKIKKAKLEEVVAKLLLIHYTEEELANIYANLNKEASQEVIKKYNEAIRKYVEEEMPFQYITGIQNFFGYDFKVNESVLIPRRETEELVERVIYYIEDNFGDRKIDVLDIGTGSGCIAITLDKELDNVSVTAVDISNEALEVAKENNQKLSANVKFKLGDLYEPVKGEKYDVIVSNPPYIIDYGYIGKTVKHEPKVSLYGGADGLNFYRRIISESRDYLKENGVIAFEHAYDTAKELEKIILGVYPNAKVTLYQDLSGYDRITFIEVGEIDGKL